MSPLAARPRLMSQHRNANADAEANTGAAPDSEQGSVTLLVLGLTVVAILLIVVTIAVTAVSLARTRLMDAADSVALASANAFDESTYAGTGIGDAVPISDATVQRSAADHLGDLTLPAGITGWTIAPGTGTPDNRTAVVVLTGQVRVPFAATFGSDASFGLTVTSRARAGLG